VTPTEDEELNISDGVCVASSHTRRPSTKYAKHPALVNCTGTLLPLAMETHARASPQSAACSCTNSLQCFGTAACSVSRIRYTGSVFGAPNLAAQRTQELLVAMVLMKGKTTWGWRELHLTVGRATLQTPSWEHPSVLLLPLSCLERPYFPISLSRQSISGSILQQLLEGRGISAC
jgi:hypothetical protein